MGFLDAICPTCLQSCPKHGPQMQICQVLEFKIQCLHSTIIAMEYCCNNVQPISKSSQSSAVPAPSESVSRNTMYHSSSSSSSCVDSQHCAALVFLLQVQRLHQLSCRALLHTTLQLTSCSLCISQSQASRQMSHTLWLRPGSRSWRRLSKVGCSAQLALQVLDPAHIKW